MPRRRSSREACGREGEEPRREDEAGGGIRQTSQNLSGRYEMDRARPTFPKMMARSIERTESAGSWSSRFLTASMSYSWEPWMKRIVLNRSRLCGESGRDEARNVRNDDVEDLELYASTVIEARVEKTTSQVNITTRGTAAAVRFGRTCICELFLHCRGLEVATEHVDVSHRHRGVECTILKACKGSSQRA